MKNRFFASSLFFVPALAMLLCGLVFGLMSAAEYLYPSWLRPVAGFEVLRPMHVSAVLFWILLACNAVVYAGLTRVLRVVFSKKVLILHAGLWVLSIAGIFTSYLRSDFGGREYWEFNPVWALPLILAWLLLLIQFFRHLRHIRIQPVYIWMWMTGIVFFLFTFLENYLWVFPYFRGRMIGDMTLQWKSNGSLVGSWNQIVYGTSFFLMDKIDGGQQTGRSKTAFGMYFLGLFNLMFNWGHHVYTLPAPDYVRFVAYAVSMTEWVFFIRIVYTWKQTVSKARRLYYYFPFRFLLAADLWVFLNMGQAIVMSVPAFNLYTHGTHVTVAHAMGTSIGINSMILFAAAFCFLPGNLVKTIGASRLLGRAFWMLQLSLLFFCLFLNAAGIVKGLWQMQAHRVSFAHMMAELRPYFTGFFVSGFVLLVAASLIAFYLLKLHWKALVSGVDLDSESDLPLADPNAHLKTDKNIRNNLHP